jgi:hypothetical protein
MIMDGEGESTAARWVQDGYGVLRKEHKCRMRMDEAWTAWLERGRGWIDAQLAKQTWADRKFK